MKTAFLSFLLALCVLVGFTAQVQAQSYSHQVAQGEALVQEFGRLFQGNASIDALEEMAVRISQNYQARLLLKNKYKDLGRIYHNIWLRGQRSLSQRMIAKARECLRGLGYSGRAVDDLHPGHQHCSQHQGDEGPHGSGYRGVHHGQRADPPVHQGA